MSHIYTTYFSIIQIVDSNFQETENKHADGCCDHQHVGIPVREIFFWFCSKCCHQKCVPRFYFDVYTTTNVSQSRTTNDFTCVDNWQQRDHTEEHIDSKGPSHLRLDPVKPLLEHLDAETTLIPVLIGIWNI